MGKNVMIPLSLLDRMIELLDCLALPEYHELRYDCCDILWALKVKKQKIELRDAYAKIILADDLEARHLARNEYLRERGQLKDMVDGDIPF
jgi:hypothetical protein